MGWPFFLIRNSPKNFLLAHRDCGRSGGRSLVSWSLSFLQVGLLGKSRPPRNLGACSLFLPGGSRSRLGRFLSCWVRRLLCTAASTRRNNFAHLLVFAGCGLGGSSGVLGGTSVWAWRLIWPRRLKSFSVSGFGNFSFEWKASGSMWRNGFGSLLKTFYGRNSRADTFCTRVRPRVWARRSRSGLARNNFWFWSRTTNHFLWKPSF